MSVGSPSYQGNFERERDYITPFGGVEAACPVCAALLPADEDLRAKHAAWHDRLEAARQG